MNVTINRENFDRVMAEKGCSTLGDISRATGISRPYLSQILNGHRGVGMAFVTKMLTELNVPFTFAPDSIYQLEEA